MNISTILNSLYNRGIHNLVLADTSTNYFENKALDSYHVIEIDDVRAAGFFALGQSQTSSVPVVVAVESRYIDSMYTSLVEAWFQHIPVVVIVLDQEDNADYSLFQRCVKAFVDYRFSDASELDVSLSLPSFIICPVKKKEETILIDDIIGKLPTGTKTFISAEKYCAISKYVGYLCGTDESVVCIIPIDWVKLDLNIFNNRYIDERFKLILKGESDNMPFDLNNWFQNNKIKFFEGADCLPIFLQENSPSVILVS